MAQTRKQKKVLCYTGIYRKKSGIHTEKEFLNITRKFSKSKASCNHWKTGKYVCPKDGDLEGWMKWTGAAYDDEKSCRKAAKFVDDDLKKLKKDQKEEKKVLKELKKCEAQKCASEAAAVKKEQPIYDKKQATCPQKTAAFLTCSSKMFDASNLKRYYEEAEHCRKTKCAKLYKRLKEIRGL